MTPWRRQPDESAADFNAFVAYLCLKNRRSLRAAAARTGWSVAALRRLSARFNWPARVLAFEERLARVKEDALALHLRASASAEKTRLENLRLDEFALAQNVLRAANRWLQLASDPRRRHVPLNQLLRLVDLATELGRRACGLPFGEPKKTRFAEPPGYWTQPSVEEAIERIYGARAPSAPVNESPPAPAPVPSPEQPPDHAARPPDSERDLSSFALQRDPHGLLRLHPVEAAQPAGATSSGPSMMNPQQ